MSKYRHLWKQANPFDQHIVILMAMEGNIAVSEDGIIGWQDFRSRMKVIYEQLKELEPHLQNGKWLY